MKIWWFKTVSYRWYRNIDFSLTNIIKIKKLPSQARKVKSYWWFRKAHYIDYELSLFMVDFYYSKVLTFYLCTFLLDCLLQVLRDLQVYTPANELALISWTQKWRGNYPLSSVPRKPLSDVCVRFWDFSSRDPSIWLCHLL